MKILTGILGLVFLIFAIGFAFSNKAPVTVEAWPLDFKLNAPLSLFTLGAFLGGLLFGILATWIAMLPHRLHSFRLEREISRLQILIQDLRQTIIPPNDNSLSTLAIKSIKAKWQYLNKKLHS